MHSCGVIVNSLLLLVGNPELMIATSYVFDIGNTRIKGARFEQGKLIDSFNWSASHGFPADLIIEAPAIVSSVAKTSIEWKVFRQPPLIFDRQTPLPIQIDYDTPHTLGLDRIAGAVGAADEFPNEDVLVVDLGTCVNYDFIDRTGTFQGGVISPGFEIRMRAMHEFTGALPDIREEWHLVSSAIPAKSTKGCIKQGAFQALTFEIESFIRHFQKKSSSLTVILTGGDAGTFESYIKEPIFVRPKIVLQGLNKILAYNVAK